MANQDQFKYETLRMLIAWILLFILTITCVLTVANRWYAVEMRKLDMDQQRQVNQLFQEDEGAPVN